MKSGGFPGLQNQCDLTESGRVGSIPIHSRQSATNGVGRETINSYLLRASRLVSVCAVVIALPAAAQRPDSSRLRPAPAPAPSRDTLKPPLSPRRAFLYSALVPGLAQSKLGRNKAAAVMLTIEAMALAMIHESGADVREARSMSGDSVVVSYVGPNGESLATPILVPRRFDSQYVHVRQSHVEDWVAFLIANHLFSGADAFVAANLWDVPAQLQIRAMPSGASVGVKLTW